MKSKVARRERRAYREKLRLDARNKGERNIVIIKKSQRHMRVTVISPLGRTISQVQSPQEGIRCYNGSLARQLARILRDRLKKLKVNCKELLCRSGGNGYSGIIRDFMEELKNEGSK